MIKLEDMTLREKIGQMMVTGFPAGEMNEEFMQLVREYKVGNVILFSYNQHSYSQLCRLCSSVQTFVRKETGVQAFITSDEEGGVVSRFPRDMAKFPSAMAQAAICDSGRVKKAAKLVARQLRAVGINFNLAPVLDVNNNKANPVIGVRSYGTTAKDVCTSAMAAFNGYNEEGILTTGKHFPGHGDTAVDSHLGLPVIEKTLRQLEDLELLPFKEAITCGLPAITIAHVLFPALEAQKVPATMSGAIVTGLLREKLGFKGLIISDCMEMDAIKKYYGVSKGVLEAVKAGIDLVFISRTASEVKAAIECLEQAMQSGELPVQRIDDAASRILAYKRQYKGETRPLATGELEDIRAIAQQFYEDTIASSRASGQPKFVLGKEPLFISPLRKAVTLASNLVTEEYSFAKAMQKRFGGNACVIGLNPDEEEIETLCRLAGQSSSVVLGTVNGSIHAGQTRLAERLAEAGKPFAWVALRNPFELEKLPVGAFGLALYEYAPNTVEIAMSYFYT